jgi:hypothetical protein
MPDGVTGRQMGGRTPNSGSPALIDQALSMSHTAPLMLVSVNHRGGSDPVVDRRTNPSVGAVGCVEYADWRRLVRPVVGAHAGTGRYRAIPPERGLEPVRITSVETAPASRRTGLVDRCA